MPMNGMQAMAYNMNGNMNMNMNTNMNAMQPRRIHINPKFAGARPPQLSNTINQSSNANGSLNNNNSNKSQPSNINQASNSSVKRSSNEAFTNNNESNDRDQKQRKTNNHTHASSSTSSPRHSSSSSQIKSSSPSTIESTRSSKDSVRDTKENKSHRQQLSEQRHTSTTGRDRDIAGVTIEAREKRREFLKTERETLERGEDYKIPTYNPLGVRNSGVKPIPFTKTSMFSIRGAALAAAESISPSKDSNSNTNRSNQYLDTRHGNPLGVQHNSSSNNRIAKNKVPIQQRLGNMNGSTSGNGNESNKNKNNNPTSSPQRNNNNGASNPIPISTNGKSSKLKINYIANDVNDANIRAMEYGSGIKYIKFNREKETAIAEFNSIDNAVNFRRKHNRSLLSGKHISISFCTGSD
ncbi:hypothetical protein BJ944DRAFT_269441 [Cunninghamella echinulata]|nr:hypothetical protein BJ944DRAFT_269441 [Cunninghamella echinulata]